MILHLAIVVGLVGATIRAWWGRRHLSPPLLSRPWLAAIAFLPQLYVLHLPAVQSPLSDELAPVALIASQTLLLAFVWCNRRQPGGWLLGFGLTMNLLVITANGGLMPISPQMVAKLVPNASPGSWEVGSRLWQGKDIVLTLETTRLWWLSDWLFSPAWFPYRVAFSPGDVLMSCGAFRMVWSVGEPPSPKHSPANDETAVDTGEDCACLPSPSARS